MGWIRPTKVPIFTSAFQHEIYLGRQKEPVHFSETMVIEVDRAQAWRTFMLSFFEVLKEILHITEYYKGLFGPSDGGEPLLR
jgi:hypothetical protein